MSDAPKNSPTLDDVKTAEVVGKGGSAAPTTPKVAEISFLQQVFIWAMILLVGVIFGVGSSWTLLSQGSRTIDGVNENDILLRQDTAKRLQEAINPTRRGPEQFEYQDYKFYAKHLQYARLADQLGLLPAGADLDRVVDEFLAKPVAGQANRTHRDLLAERQGAKEEITRAKLRQYLAERTAVEALYARNLIIPAIPTAAADEIQAFIRESIQADIVVLTADHLMPAVPADDPEIQATYDRLRPLRFATPASLEATIAKADLTALAAAALVSDTEIQARYDQTKETYRQPNADPKAPAEYRPLAVVAPEIRAALAQSRAEDKAQELITAFNTQIDEQNLDKADKAAFAAAAAKAGLIVTEVRINAPQDGQIDLGDLGRIKDPAGLHGKEPGFISNPLQGSSVRTWFVVRVDAQHPAGFQDLAQVKDAVTRVVAGSRAYKALLEQAEKLRAEAEKRGPGGLSAVMSEPAQAAWKANVTQEPLQASTSLKAPASEPGGVPGEGRLAASLTLPARPVALAEDPAAGDAPQVRLIQVRAITPAPAPDAAMVPRLVDAWRGRLTAWRSRLYENELRSQLDGK